VPIIFAFAALPAMALLLMAVSRLEANLDRPRDRTPAS
jgi:hypothetical protein